MSETKMQTNRADEARLIQAAQAGNAEAFAELFNRWNEPLLRYLYHTLGNGQEAEDLAQDAFLRAYQRLEQLGPPWDFKSWLYRIATNLAMDHLQRERRYVEVTDSDEAVDMQVPDDMQPVERQVEKFEQGRQVWRALGILPTLYRQALILRELHGLSYEELQVALDCSLENARQMVHRARLRFRDEYGFASVVAAGMPRCRVLGDLLSAYHDGQLGATQRREVEQHLSTCEECRGTRDDMNAIGILLLGLPPLAPSVGWLEKVRGRLRSEAAGRGAGGDGGATSGGGGRGGGHEPDRSDGGEGRGGGPEPDQFGGGGGRGGPRSGPLVIGGIIVIIVAGLWFFAGRPPLGSGGGQPTASQIALSASATPPLGEDAASGQLTETATLESSPTPSATLSPSPSDTPVLPVMLTFLQNANCRKGPGAVYNIVTGVPQGAQIRADGRNDAGTWLDIPGPGSQVHCWVLASTADASVSPEGLPILPPPVLPSAPNNFSDHADCQAKAKSYSVKLFWTDVPNASGYHIYRNGTLLQALRANASTYLDSSAPLGTAVTYEIDGFNDNGSSARSALSVPLCK